MVVCVCVCVCVCDYIHYLFNRNLTINISGIFASQDINPNGYDGWIHGNPKQLANQLLGVVIAIVWAGFWTLLYVKAMKYISRNMFQLRKEEEDLGLDFVEHGGGTYPHIPNLSSYRLHVFTHFIFFCLPNIVPAYHELEEKGLERNAFSSYAGVAVESPCSENEQERLVN